MSWPRPDLTIEQAMMPPLIWAAMMGYASAPLETPALAALALAFAAVCAASRNIAVIGTAVALSALGFRWFYRASDFYDQQWIQWFSISMPMAGLNLVEPTEYVKMSWAAYLPAGNWFGGLFMAMGLHDYWNVWHFILVAIYALPLLVFRQFPALLAFTALSHFQPMLAYTSSGGNIEVGSAALFVTVWLMRCGQWSAATVLGAFALMIRQTTLLAGPFVLLALWRAGARRHAAALAGLCLVGGGFFLVMNPAAAMESIRFHLSLSADKWLTEPASLHSAFTAAGLAYGLGIPAEFLLDTLRPFYLPATAVWCFGLLAAAWRRPPEQVVLLGCAAQLGAYFLGRYGLNPYIPSAALPMAAFLIPAGRWPEGRGLARIVTTGVLTTCLTVMIAPGLLWAAAKFSTGPAGTPAKMVAATRVDRSGARIQSLALDRRIPPVTIPLDDAIEFEISRPASPRAIRFAGPECVYADDHGVKMWWVPAHLAQTPVELELWSASPAGSFQFAAVWKIASTLNAYPVTLALPPIEPAARFRLVCRRAHRGSRHWALSHVELLE